MYYCYLKLDTTFSFGMEYFYHMNKLMHQIIKVGVNLKRNTTLIFAIDKTMNLWFTFTSEGINIRMQRCFTFNKSIIYPLVSVKPFFDNTIKSNIEGAW